MARLIETPDGNLSQGIRQLNGVYIPKSSIRYTIERFAITPRLSEIFSQIKNKKGRNEKIYAACIEYGYTLKEIADYLGIHYSTVSKAIKNEIKKQEQNSQFNRLLKKSFFSQTRPWANKSKILSAGLPEANRIVFEK